MTALQKTALATSFVVTSALGCAFIYLYWSAKGAAGIGIGRAIAFVAIMACVYVIGYLLYQQQSHAAVCSTSTATIQIPFRRIADSYPPAMKFAVLQQIVFLALTSLLLDGGLAFRACCIAAIVHWICMAMMLVRRPAQPTRVDIAVIKYGFLPLAFVVGSMAPVIHIIIPS